jgi:hypothetical protein
MMILGLFNGAIQQHRTEELAQAVTLLNYIRNAPGSNLGREIDYGEIYLLGFSVPPGKYRHDTSNQTGPLPAKTFPVLYSSTIPLFDAVES